MMFSVLPSVAVLIALLQLDSTPSTMNVQSANSPQFNESADRCGADSLNLQAMPQIVIATKAYKLNRPIILFMGCSKGRFATASAPSIEERHVYKIYYHIDPARNLSEYVAPIVHELAHVYQSEHVGSWGKLYDNFCKMRIELGADYLSGFIYKNYLRIRPPDWEDNLEIFGDFELDNPDFHGDPGLRVSAFRYGYFTNINTFNGDIAAIYDRFQDFDLRKVLYQQFGRDEKCDI